MRRQPTASPSAEAPALSAALLGAVNQAVIATDREGLVTFWNKFAEAIYGWSEAEAIGRSIAEISAGDSSSQDVGISATLAKGEATSGQRTVTHRDGSSRRVWVTASSFPGPDGQPAGIVGTAVELTAGDGKPELWATKTDFLDAVTAGIEAARVRTSEQMYRTLFEQAADGFMVTSASGRLEAVNAAWERMFGYDSFEAMELSLEDLCDPEEIKLFPPNYEEVKGSGSMISRRSARRRDGSIFPTENNATSFSGKHILISVRDITDRVQAEQKLRDSEAKYRGVVENAGDGIVMADRTGRIIDGNRRALEMVGCTWEEAYGRMLSDFLMPEDVEARPPGSGDTAHGPIVLERTLRRKDGTGLQVEVNATVSAEGLYIGFMRDLSDRKKAERELKAIQENYQRMVDLSPDAIIVHADGVIVYVNDAAVRLVGATSRDQMIGLSALHFLDPEYRDRVDERIDRILNQHLTVPLIEQRYRRLDGTLVDVEVGAIPLDYRGRKAVQVVLRDVTDRMRVEEALRGSEERYRGIVERATDAIYLVSEEGILTDVNPATLAITGWSLEEILSKRFAELIHPDDRQRAEAVFRSSLDQPQREAEVFRILTPTGQYVYLEMMTTPVIQESGGRALFGIGRDITAARNAEQQIRFQASLLANVRNALIANDRNGVITFWNNHAELLYGWSAEEAVGRNVEDVMNPPGPSALEEAGADLFASGRWEGETRVRRRNGQELSIYLVLATILDETGAVTGVIGSSFDVTSVHDAERELEQARRLSSLGRLAATVAHEFNNVMMGIYPFAEIIGRSADPKMVRASGHVTEALQRGKQITQEILKFARASEPMLASVDVGIFLNNAIDDLRTIAGSGVRIEVDAPDGCYMMADANQMQQVLSNLVSNGRDAMNGEGTISIGVSHCAGGGVQARRRGATDMLRITVRDHGCGIPDSELALIFEPLFTTKQSTGTGLGLAVVHQIITRHGGDVVVDSTPGLGTAFHLMIPESPAPPESHAAEEAPTVSRPSRLLLVEDDPHVGAGLVALLELEGIEVCLATLGRDAAAEIERFAPDAIILDVGLPDVDGVTLYAEIAARWPDLPVVFSTGHGDEDLLEGALKRHNVGYLLKPYGVDELLEVLARIR